MKSRRLHVLALFAVGIVACKTGAGANGSKNPPAGVSVDPATPVGEMDGQKITYGDLQADKEIGPKLTQAEVKALTDLYNTRRGLLEELLSRRMLEGEAKAKGKTLDQWFQTDYPESVPAPTEDENKAFFEEHKAQIPPGRTYEDLKPQIVQAVRQQKMRDNMEKMIASLK